MSKSILIVAAHTDDEVLGCGGTIARHVAEGDAVHLIFLTDGVSSRTSSEPKTANIFRRREASLSALKQLGIPEKNVSTLDFPDNSLDELTRLEITKKIEAIVQSQQPSIIYTHHPGDLNIDHRYTYEAVMTASRPQPNFPVCSIFTFEVPSSTAWSGHSFGRAFIPNAYNDITTYWPKKRAALELYLEEMRPAPHARSIEAIKALTIYRGSQVGLEHAEAFCVERIISR